MTDLEYREAQETLREQYNAQWITRKDYHERLADLRRKYERGEMRGRPADRYPRTFI